MGVKEWIADGWRGRPAVELRSYADARGLEYCGSATQVDYIPAFPLTSELQFNVLRGTLPGGEQGILYHEVDLLDEATASGTFYGQKVSLSQARPEDLISLTGITGEPVRYFKVPHTTAAIRIPPAQGPLVGFDVGRSGERVIHAAPKGEGFKAGFTLDLSFLSRRKKRKQSEEPLLQGPQPFIGRDLAYMGLPDWRIAYRGRADEAVVEQLIAGPLSDVLAADPPVGFRITFAYGVLVVTRQHFLKEHDELDEFARRACRLAGRIRELCAANASPRPFETELEPPPWAAKIDESPDETWVGMDNQDLAGFHAIARERGLDSEDPFAFHRAFCDLPVPGEAYGVMRGRLPGTSLFGRVVAGVERTISGPPAYWDRILGELPHGPCGSDAVLVAVRPDAPDAHPDTGMPWGDGGFAVRRGVLVAWQPRLGTPQADGGKLDQLVSTVARLAEDQRLL
ncbi:MAG TPA: hypothetical protein VD836_06340 [Solirubrobacteraceae bacterium]|nr:hypothetical protein [Solirubrobacteraceae bacterium]